MPATALNLSHLSSPHFHTFKKHIVGGILRPTFNQLLLLKNFQLFYVCECFAYMCMPGAQLGQKRVWVSWSFRQL